MNKQHEPPAEPATIEDLEARHELAYAELRRHARDFSRVLHVTGPDLERLTREVGTLDEINGRVQRARDAADGLLVQINAMRAAEASQAPAPGPSADSERDGDLLRLRKLARDLKALGVEVKVEP